jgi:hypothetical protein
MYWFFPIFNPIQIKLESPEDSDGSWWEIRRSTRFHFDAIFGYEGTRMRTPPSDFGGGRCGVGLGLEVEEDPDMWSPPDSDRLFLR